jgi:hypothetical protein
MKPYQVIALALSFTLLAPAAFSQQSSNQPPSYETIYSGGSLPGVKSNQYLQLHIGSDAIRLYAEHHGRQRDDEAQLSLMASSITDLSYGQEVHRRVGTAVAVGVLSLGVGLLVVLSKSKKHYIGIVWSDGSNKGGMVLQADKNEFRGILAALEGLTGKKAVNTDTPTK